MEKNILKATLVAAFALFAGFNVYSSYKSDVMSDLALANVEALALTGEESGTTYQTMSYCKPWTLTLSCTTRRLTDPCTHPCN
ncbi:NVEALA domain-containing protein [Phocaeicola sp.]